MGEGVETMNDKPVVSPAVWRGVGNALVFALTFWAILALLWLA